MPPARVSDRSRLKMLCDATPEARENFTNPAVAPLAELGFLKSTAVNDI